jgi:YesN/AraC family two-component response regulator
MLFEANLEKKFHIITAENGIKGLELISVNNDIKVVVSDMKMPVMSGIEFIQRARNNFPEINYYILTGFEITDEIQQALDNGLIRKYFRKPFNMNEISSEIEQVIHE